MKIIIALLAIFALTACEDKGPTPSSESKTPNIEQPDIPAQPPADTVETPRDDQPTLLPTTPVPTPTPAHIIEPEPIPVIVNPAPTPSMVIPPAGSPVPVVPTPSPTPTVQQIETITYYEKNITAAPINGWVNKTYTAKGSCLEYENEFYCWDDGVHTLSWIYNHFQYGGSYTYWGLEVRTNTDGFSHCYGGCDTSYMSEPHRIEYQLEMNISAADIQNIFNTGTPRVATCQRTEHELDCGSFILGDL